MSTNGSQGEEKKEIVKKSASARDKYKKIGQNVYRKEGLDKLTGDAKYVDDVPEREGELHGVTVRSTVPRGRLKDIHFQDGIPWDEFVIVTAEDIPGENYLPFMFTDQPFLAKEQIMHKAEPVVLLAHPDKQLAEKARDYVELEIEEQEPTLSIEESLQTDNPQYEDDNVFKEITISSGNPESQFEQADVVLEETYRTGSQEQLYIEPQGMIAKCDPEAPKVTVEGSLQCPYYIHDALEILFGLEGKQIRVIQHETGGGFGGKEDYPDNIAGHAALLSWKAGGQPVRIIYDRQEDLLCTPKRHPSRTTIKAGFSEEGRLLALDIDYILDGGGYSTLSPVVLSRGVLHSYGPYRVDHSHIRGRAVLTNSVPYGAMRGFGAPQSIFPMELHMTRAAHELGMDPAEIRRKNFLERGDRMPTGQVVREDIDLEMMLDRAIEKSNYHEKREEYEEYNRNHDDVKKGINLSFFFHGAGFSGGGEKMLGSRVHTRLTPEGYVEVLTANVEYGQGTNTTFTQITSEACNIPTEWVKIHRIDTDEVPNSGPTVASRTTMVVGRLVERACQKLRVELQRHTGLPANWDEEEFRECALQYLEEHGELETEVHYTEPEDSTYVDFDDETYTGDAYTGYSWTCDVAEVEIDQISYLAEVTDFVSVVECGRVINPVLAAGQIEGGIAQAIGFALYENVVVEDGAMKNNQYTNYIIPTSADAPDIDVEFVEFPFANYGAFDAKGIGELPIDGPAPAIAGAVAHALGNHFISDLPMIPERIMNEVEDTEHRPLVGGTIASEN